MKTVTKIRRESTEVSGKWKMEKGEVKTHRPKFRVGLNPTVHFLYSGFRPRGHYLEAVGLNPED